MKSNAPQVRKLLSGLTDLDFHYLGIQIAMAKDSRQLISTFNVSKEAEKVLTDVAK